MTKNNFVQEMQRWDALAWEWQFLTSGYPVEILIGQQNASMTVRAEPTVLVTGAVQPGSSHGVLSFSGRPLRSSQPDATGAFQVRLERENARLLIDQSHSFRIIDAVVPVDATEVDLGAIAPPDPAGALHITVTENGAHPDEPVSVSLMRTDGVVWLPLGMDDQGQLRSASYGWTDPRVNPPPIPAGEYVVMMDTNAVEPLHALAAYVAATQGVAAAEFATMPRITVTEGQTTTATLDLAEIEARSRALVRAVYY